MHLQVIEYVRVHVLGSDAVVDLVGFTEGEIIISFNAFDRESGTMTARWWLGSFPGAYDAHPPVYFDHRQRGAALSVTGLVDGAYYFATLEIYNNAGNWAFQSSEPFLVDIRAPYCGKTMDGPRYDRVFLGPAIAREFVWIQLFELGRADVQISWSNYVDYGAGIAGYAAAFVRDDALASALNETAVEMVSNTSAFTAVGMDQSVSLATTLEHNTRYWTVVSTWDTLYNERKCTSDSILFDGTPPNMSKVNVTNIIAITRHVQRVRHMIRVDVLGIFDDESGIGQLMTSVGTADTGLQFLRDFTSGSEAVLLTELSLPEGEIIVTMRAVNRARDHSDAQLAIGVDTTPPVCSEISVNGHPVGQKMHYTDDMTTLFASWDCLDSPPWAAEPMVCRWAVGTYPFGSDAMEWDDAISSGVHTWSSATLLNGVTYFVTVECTDHVGWQSQMIASGGLMPDLLPPKEVYPPLVVDPITGSAIRWASSSESLSVQSVWHDGESGVGQILAAVTTSQIPPVDFEEVSFPLSSRRTLLDTAQLGIQLQHTGTYWVHVCASDGFNRTACTEQPYRFQVRHAAPRFSPSPLQCKYLRFGC